MNTEERDNYPRRREDARKALVTVKMRAALEKIAKVGAALGQMKEDQLRLQLELVTSLAGMALLHADDMEKIDFSKVLTPAEFNEVATDDLVRLYAR